MAYSADTFVADEQPTTAKWNKLWSNDASFNDGTGIADDAILARHLSSNIVGANELSSSAIYLGYGSSTSNQGSITTVETDLTSLTATVTVPSGSRNLLLIADMHMFSTVGGDFYSFKMKESSTTIKEFQGRFQTNSGQEHFSFITRISAPSAGSHTYKCTLVRASGSGTLSTYASSTSIAEFIVMAI